MKQKENLKNHRKHTICQELYKSCLIIYCVVVLAAFTSCNATSGDSGDSEMEDKTSGLDDQVKLDVQVNQDGAEIYNVTVDDNVSFRGEDGIGVNFDCRAYGFSGYPLYFYAYVLYENDFDFVKTAGGEKVYGFDIGVAMYDATQFNGITLYIPYSSLPKRYHGELCIDIVIIDGFDNIVATNANNRIFYSTI